MSETAEDEPKIYEVWRHNLDQEFERIMKIIDTHTVIGMDTEFPGEVFNLSYSPSGNPQYDKVKVNVDQLNLIQLGLTFSTPSSSPTKSTYTWQFNFYFDEPHEWYHYDSIKLLETAGINLDRHRTDGIDTHIFGEYLTTSGIVCNDRMTWSTFHASYDFGYLVKVLTNNLLPRTEAEFCAEMKLFFPVVYDLKVMTQTKGGLSKLADDHKVHRHGIMHQAGSDSLLTVETFQTYVDTVLNGKLDTTYLNTIAGLKSDWPYTPVGELGSYSFSNSRSLNYSSSPNQPKIIVSPNAHQPLTGPDHSIHSHSPLPHSSQSSLISSLSASALSMGSAQPYTPLTSIFQPSASMTGQGIAPPPGVGPASTGLMARGSPNPEVFYSSAAGQPTVSSAASASPSGMAFQRDFPNPVRQFAPGQMIFPPFSAQISPLNSVNSIKSTTPLLGAPQLSSELDTSQQVPVFTPSLHSGASDFQPLQSRSSIRPSPSKIGMINVNPSGSPITVSASTPGHTSAVITSYPNQLSPSSTSQGKRKTY